MTELNQEIQSSMTEIASQAQIEYVPLVLREATAKALNAVIELSGPDSVGEHLGVDYEDSASALHRFVAHLPGYRGWQWLVVVAAVPGSEHVTISEVILTPGPDSLLAPEWIPWKQRILPGDLAPGDLLSPDKDDYRLVPAYTSSGDPDLDELSGELGLGRQWVMSPLGRAEAAQRWHTGPYGPNSSMACSARKVCRECGFFLPLAGSLGHLFGVCANAMAADGHVVDSEYGCGAHSETPPPPSLGSPVFAPFDDEILEILEFTIGH